MAKGKSPAFQFYPDSWLSSTDILLMSPAQEGAFIRLLAHAWLQVDCGLPSETQALSVLSRLGDQWDTLGPAVLAKFELVGNRYFNRRLMEERAKLFHFRQKQAENGSHGGRPAKPKRNPNITQAFDLGYENGNPNESPRVENENEIGVEVEFSSEEQKNSERVREATVANSSTVQNRTETRQEAPQEAPCGQEAGEWIRKPPPPPERHGGPSQRVESNPSDGWEPYIGVFLAAGKPINDRDLEKALRIWLGMEPDEKAAARAHAESICRGSDAQFIPLPQNHLGSKPWTRKAPKRILPAPEKLSKGDIAQREAERLYAESKGRR